MVIEDVSGSSLNADNNDSISVEQATNALLEVVRSRDLENFQAASEALYNAMIAEQNSSNTIQ